MGIRGISHSVISGFFAGLSGFFGKVSFDPDLAKTTFPSFALELNVRLLQSFLVCGLVLSNILMLRSFSKALQDSETTLQASVVNTASNFIFTAFIGFLAFKEQLSLFWWCGTSCIIIGIYLLGTDRSIDKSKIE